jgi:hypothetical protein
MFESVDDDAEREERVSSCAGDDIGPRAQQTVLKRVRLWRILIVVRTISSFLFPRPRVKPLIAATR